MKTKLFFLLLVIVGIANAQSDFSQVPDGIITDGLIGYYPFDGNANNVVSSNFNLNVVADANESENEVNYSSDGAYLGEFVDIDRFALLSTSGYADHFENNASGQFSLGFWAKIQNGTGGIFKTYVELFESAYFRDSNRFGIAASNFVEFGANVLSSSEWNHVTIVFRTNPSVSTQGQLAVYRNGIIAGFINTSANEISKFGDFFSLGGGYNGTDPNWELKNARIQLDEFSFYDRALSDMEIVQNYVAYEGNICPQSISDFTFTNQQDLELKSILYGGCEQTNFTLNIQDLGVNSIPTFPNLKSVGSLNIIGTNITSLENSFPALENIGQNIQINNNSQLNEIDDFHNIEVVGSLIKIDNSPNLQTISMLSSLETCVNFDLFNAPQLSSFTGFNSSSKIQALSLTNVGLSNLSGFAGLEIGQVATTSVPILRIQNNPNLTSIDHLQYEDLFGEFSCINNNSLVSVHGVENITRATIRFNNNPSLTNMGNFSSLTNFTPSGILPTTPSIDNNNSLTELGNLSALQNFGNHSFSIKDNNNLSSIIFFGGAIDDTTISSFVLENNPNLSQCAINAVCSLLDSNNTNITISNNGTNCNSIAEVEEECNSGPDCLQGGVDFPSQSSINQFAVDFPNCTIINGNVSIFTSDPNDLSAFNNIEVINGNLSISETSLTNELDIFPNLEIVTGNISISGMDEITSISGFNSLISVGSSQGSANSSEFIPALNINFNNNLQSITGFNSLENVNDVLRIAFNSELTNISGFESLDATSLDLLIIQNNANLATCNIDFICDFLVSNSSNTTVFGNATGCSSVAEIIASCTLSNFDFLTSDVSIYPNPFSNQLTIQLPEFAGTSKVSLVDVSGRVLVQQDILHVGQITGLDELAKGLYFVKITSEDGQTITQKLIK